MEIYQEKLRESGQVSKEGIDRINNKVLSILNEEFLASKEYVPQRRDWLSAFWHGFKSPEQLSRIRNTGYDLFHEHFVVIHVLYLPSFTFSMDFLLQSQARDLEDCWPKDLNPSRKF